MAAWVWAKLGNPGKPPTKLVESSAPGVTLGKGGGFTI